MDRSKPVKRLPLISPPPLPKPASSLSPVKPDAGPKSPESKDNPAGQVTGLAPNPKISAQDSTRLAGKERVFYSDFIRPQGPKNVADSQPVQVAEPSAEESSGGVKVVTIGSPNLRDLIKRRKLPAITSPKSADNEIVIQSEPSPTSSSNPQNKVEPTPYFSTVNEPKVIISHESRMGLTPRKLAIERKKRIFAEQNIRELLATHGVTERDYDMIEPSGGAGGALPLVEVQQSRAKSFLPLHLFDDTDWDERPAIEWLSYNPHEKFIHHQSRVSLAKIPVPAVALIPGQSGLLVWESVMVTAYDFSKELWKIVPDPSVAAAAPKPNPAGKPNATTWTEYWIHKINLMFKSEDPFKFAKRVAEAHNRRRQVEDNIRFQFYVDGMPTMGPGGLDLADASVKRIIQLSAAKNLQKSKGFMQSAWVQNSIRDIKNDYSRTMNAIALEVTVC